MSDSIHLGDGAYATFKGFEVEIWCERENGKHCVYLEPEAVQNLIDFLRSKGWKLEAKS